MNRHAWKRTPYGWRHAPWWKVAINTVLRALQPGLRRKLVIYTRCIERDGYDDEPPDAIGYGIGLVDHRSRRR